MNETHKTIGRMRSDAKAIFAAGLRAVDPQEAVLRHCRLQRERFHIGRRVYDLTAYRRIWIIGAGKASAPMAAALEGLLGDRIGGGVVNVKYGYTRPLERVELVEAGHPVPDENGRRGSERMLDIASRAGPDDLVLCLMSGGGSALTPLPAAGLTLQDKQDTIKVLLACGASIHDINTIRKHTSLIKGGRIARGAYPATLAALILSDVVGDDLDVIASGPTVPDSSTFADCRGIFDQYGIASRLPSAVVDHIASGAAGEVPESPKAGDAAFDNTHNVIVGSNFEAILAAKRQAETMGYTVLVLSSMIEGETRHVAHVHGAVAREILKSGYPIGTPACILSGGETTVTLRGDGLGGRNQEFALAAAIDVADHPRIVVLSAGTDGTDGPTDAAGAVADSDTLQRARTLGMDARRYLAGNDSYHFFQKLDDLLLTGPTHTNVMDLRIVLAAGTKGDRVPRN